MTTKTAETPEAILGRLSKESKKLDALMIEKREVGIKKTQTNTQKQHKLSATKTIQPQVSFEQ